MLEIFTKKVFIDSPFKKIINGHDEQEENKIVINITESAHKEDSQEEALNFSLSRKEE